MVFLYIILQIGIWWFLHIATFFWKITFPFHARSVAKSNRVKYIHIGCVIAGLVLPLVPIIAVMGDFALKLKNDKFLKSNNVTFTSGGLGFTATAFPAAFCHPVNEESTFYVLLVPIIVLLAIGSVLLVLIIHQIHKVSIILSKKFLYVALDIINYHSSR